MLSTPPATAINAKARQVRASADSAWLVAAITLIYGVIATPRVMDGEQTALVLAAAAALAAVLIALTVIDIRTMRLPDLLSYPLLVGGLALSAISGMPQLVWSAGSAVLGGLALYAIGEVYLRFRGRQGLGFGDAKLVAAAGAWVDAEGLASVLLIACAAALALIAAWRISGRDAGGSMKIPFGPFLALGLWTVWLYGPLA